MNLLTVNQALTIVVRETVPFDVQQELWRARSIIAELEAKSGYQICECGHAAIRPLHKCLCGKTGCYECMLCCSNDECAAVFCATCDVRVAIDCGCLTCPICAEHKCDCGESRCWRHEHQRHTFQDHSHCSNQDQTQCTLCQRGQRGQAQGFCERLTSRQWWF